MIKTVSDYLNEVNTIFKKWHPSKHLFFRGHSNKKEFELIPTVLRPPKQNERNLNERQILLDFFHYSPAHSINYQFYSERDKILIDMQHFGIPTRLLDWTFAPLNALFFCCCEFNDKDGEVIIFNPWRYWDKIIIDKKDKEIHKKHKEIHKIHVMARALLSGNWPFRKIKSFINKSFDYKDLLKKDIEKPFAFVGNYTNNRILHQRGCFTIHGINPAAIDKFILAKREIERIFIPALRKENLLLELNQLYINDYSIFPDFEGMKKMIKKRGSLFNI